MNPRTWRASGHTATFADPLVECGACHGRFRADKIADGISESVTTEEFKALNVKCPTCGKTEWGDIRKFNMMFQTNVGPVNDESSIAYLAQRRRRAFLRTIRMSLIRCIPTCRLGWRSKGRLFAMRFRRVISFCAIASARRWRSSISCIQTSGKMLLRNF